MAPQGAHIPCPRLSTTLSTRTHGVLPLLLVAGHSCAPKWNGSSLQLIRRVCAQSPAEPVGGLLPTCLCCFTNRAGCW